MTDATQMKQTIRAVYAARVAEDLDGSLAHFADDAVFQFNGPAADLPGQTNKVSGLANIRTVLADYFSGFRFANWKEVSLITEGDRAVLHWQADVTLVPVGRTARFDVFDFITFRDGKIVHFHQSTDTAKIKSLAEGIIGA